MLGRVIPVESCGRVNNVRGRASNARMAVSSLAQRHFVSGGAIFRHWPAVPDARRLHRKSTVCPIGDEPTGGAVPTSRYEGRNCVRGRAA